MIIMHKMIAMYKITGTLTGIVGRTRTPLCSKTIYAKSTIGAKLKLFFMKRYYDIVNVEKFYRYRG